MALGTLADGQLEVEVLHRFPNGGVSAEGGLYWDVLGLWREILHGLRLAASHGPIESVGVNSWAVDYALLDEDGLVMGGVHHYRDARTDGVMEAALARVPKETVYDHTGIQFLPFNTLYQLLAHRQQAPNQFARARRLLLLPDLLHHWLSGKVACEATNASTTQFYDPQRGDWSFELLEAFDLPADLLPEIVPPGTVLGELSPELQRETGLIGTRVVLPGTHDTASAVAAVPARGTDWAYVSSGTWSLVGLELPEPVLTPEALAANLTNEAGVNGTTRLLKNVMGLWIIQECCRAWNRSDFAALYAEAERVPTPPLFDPDDPRFLPPGLDMPGRVQAACRELGERVPETQAEIVRCVLESLADKTAQVLDTLEHVAGRTIRTVHVVGGGSQAALLNRLIAQRSGRTVVAGPVEATLTGNLLVQAAALGHIAPTDLREVVRASSTLQTFEPQREHV